MATFTWPATGGGSGGLSSLNADTTAAQTLGVGSTGTDFAIVDGGSGAHTLNLPSASSSARGLVTTGSQTIAGAKLLTGALTLSSAAVAASSGGDLAIVNASSTPALSLHDSAGARQAQIDRSTTLGLVLRNTAGIFSFMDAYTGTTRLWSIENAAIYCRFGNPQVGAFGTNQTMTIGNGGSGAAGTGQIMLAGIDVGGSGLGGDVSIQCSTGGTAAKVVIKSGTGGSERFRADNTGLGFFAKTPAAQQTGGSATASGTYGATEQGMLQKAYDCLRTFGLLS